MMPNGAWVARLYFGPSQYRLTANARGQGTPARARILARIGISPSVHGSTWSAAACRATRTKSPKSRPLAGSLPWPSRRGARSRRHSCSRAVRRAVMPRAVWLLTAPRLIFIAAAISASDRSA